MPLEQIGNALTFEAYYTNNGSGATGLTVTVDVWELTAAGVAAEIVAAANATEMGDGLYYYQLASGSVDAEAIYTAVFKTADACDQAHIAAGWVVGPTWVENVDQSLSATESNVRGADGDTLETLSDQIDGLPTDADVNAQVDVALADIDLDHFIQVTAGNEEPTDGSYLDQIMHKDGNQTFSSATDSLEALRDALVRSAAAGTIDADELTVIRGDTYDSDEDNAIEGLGDISDRTKLWIVVKKSANNTDLEATIFCEETDGITRLNGAAYATAAHSVITVSDENAGDLRWQLDEAVTDDLVPGLYFYDIQTRDSSGDVKTWRNMAQFTVLPDVARVII